MNLAAAAVVVAVAADNLVDAVVDNHHAVGFGVEVECHIRIHPGILASC